MRITFYSVLALFIASVAFAQEYKAIGTDTVEVTKMVTETTTAEEWLAKKDRLLQAKANAQALVDDYTSQIEQGDQSFQTVNIDPVQAIQDKRQAIIDAAIQEQIQKNIEGTPSEPLSKEQQTWTNWADVSSVQEGVNWTNLKDIE